MRYLIYARVSPRGSTWGGGETTIPDQIAACRQYALARDPGATFEAVQDEFQSGSSARRPGYRRIIEQLESGNPPWDVLIVRHLDRLTRSLTDAIPLLALLRDSGRGLVAVSQNLDLSNPTGRAMLHIILTFAQWEREMCSERTRAKMVSICEAGGWPVGLPPYGYRRAGKRQNILVPDPHKAPIVREVFRRYAAGDSPVAICREFRLARNSLWNMLRNPVYRGLIRYGGKEYPGKHEPILTRAEWDAAQPATPAGAEHRPRPNAHLRHVFLLAGLVRCPCGAAMTCTTAKGHAGGSYPYYQCTDTVKCRKRAPAAALEAAVLDVVKAARYSPREIDTLLRAVDRRRKADLARTAPEAREIDLRLAEIGRTADGMEKAMVCGLIGPAAAPAWNARYAGLQAERAELDARRADLSARQDGPGSPWHRLEAVVRELPGLGSLLDRIADDPHQVRRLLACHLARVEVGSNGEPPRVVWLTEGSGFAHRTRVASPRGFEPLLPG